MKTKDLGNKEIMSENIKRHLNNKRLNVKEFSEIMGFKYTTVLDWVNAKTYPRIDKIELMARYFGIDKSDLVEEYSEATSTLSEINKISEQLDEERQEVVLNTAKEQRDEQEAERKAKEPIPLHMDDEAIYGHIDRAAAWQGEELTEEDRDAIMIALKKHLEEKAKEESNKGK
ncbi:helix-turn-helix domain-containing protein [Lactococcus garvieae]|uniref:CI-like repressor n=1 Tax=Lactococcus garvieae DCC43 TaxID=1231377 RepID=K2PSG6_9LACT|nr:cI-like repressor [Lactococcus garvieae DCC43]